VVTSTAVFADLALARRLEGAEAAANARFVEARAKLFPESGAEWIERGGVSAMFDGVDSPCTQTFGLGMRRAPTDDDLNHIEAFYHRHGAPVHHETCPIALGNLPALLHRRGYRPIEYSSVLYRPIAPTDRWPSPPDAATTARLADDSERDRWAALSVEGWSEFTEFGAVMEGLARVSAYRESGANFLAEHAGVPVATGAMILVDGVALLAGASTIPSARRRGAQLALLGARLGHAAGLGCDLAMMVAAPGGGSQRNAERHGFRIAYTRIKWAR